MTAVALSEQTVTTTQLSKVLRKTTSTRKVGLTYRKALDLYKKNNPYYGRVEVVQNLRGQINVDYAASVRRNTGDSEFIAKKRTWGERIPNTPLVTHNGNFYLELKCEGTPTKRTYLLDGLPVTDPTLIEAIESFKKPSRSDEPVVIRDIPLTNILRLRLNKVTYRVQRG